MKIGSLLKKCFIPHKKNNHKPHILRWESAVIILTTVLVVEVLFLTQLILISPGSKFFASVLNSIIVEKTNEYRTDHQLNFMNTNALLTQAAQMKAEDMARRSYFSHDSPDGLTPWYWFQKAGYEYLYAGENLAIGFFDSNDIVSAWMDSASHRENILNARYTEFGIGVASGIYKGRETIFVAQLFGNPARKNVVVVSNSQNIQEINKDVSVDVVAGDISNVLGAEDSKTEIIKSVVNEKEVVSESLFREAAIWVISTPRTMTNYLFIVLITIITIALVLTIGIRAKVHYPGLIVHGVVMLLVISSAILFNHYLALSQMKLL